jgi:hypothetical protein
MSWMRGEFYVCTDVECACEVMIIVEPRRRPSASSTPTCACGRPMRRDGPEIVARKKEAAVR